MCVCVCVCVTAAHFKQAAMKTETFTNMFRSSPMMKLWIHSAYDPGHCVCCRGGILTLTDPITRFVYNNSADVQLTRQLFSCVLTRPEMCCCGPCDVQILNQLCSSRTTADTVPADVANVAMLILLNYVLATLQPVSL